MHVHGSESIWESVKGEALEGLQGEEREGKKWCNYNFKKNKKKKMQHF